MGAAFELLPRWLAAFHIGQSREYRGAAGTDAAPSVSCVGRMAAEGDMGKSW